MTNSIAYMDSAQGFGQPNTPLDGNVNTWVELYGENTWWQVITEVKHFELNLSSVG